MRAPWSGHNGGFPGHITSSVADPVARLAVSVLTNAVDGPADALTQAAVRLIDLACGDRARPADAAGAEDALTRFTGRFAGLWGVFDVALLGGRLFLVHRRRSTRSRTRSSSTSSTTATLRVAGGKGFGSYGEPVEYTFGDDGTVQSVRGPSGATLTPIERYSLGERVELGAGR